MSETITGTTNCPCCGAKVPLTIIIQDIRVEDPARWMIEMEKLNTARRESRQIQTDLAQKFETCQRPIFAGLRCSLPLNHEGACE